MSLSKKVTLTVLAWALLAFAALWLSASAEARTLEQRRIYAIMTVFGPHIGPQAVRVARCESGLNTWASNGQYKGAFQMGSGERKRWGHGAGMWRQAQAAKRYYDYARKHYGDGWRPWSCSPY